MPVGSMWPGLSVKLCGLPTVASDTSGSTLVYLVAGPMPVRPIMGISDGHDATAAMYAMVLMLLNSISDN